MTRDSVNRGSQLKLAREYRGYTQSDLCNKIPGLSQPNLSMFEKGFEGRVKEDKIKEIMEFLQFPIEFLDVRMPSPFYGGSNPIKTKRHE